ncbi:DUF2141 domain-containing protein [Thalassomonas viridans]|uniref:DUF2141 domain-containing protein n=1 Tax=Thalassomonas viridans TaxID=137584 RepID=A0AAF0C6A1_9GAMM|nr:DUF2141 domain-containing protein [Thalassomonas viridans]WDE04152.1 DUF2141 domain-containing protein [Thalassomonas viridans]
MNLSIYSLSFITLSTLFTSAASTRPAGPGELTELNIKISNIPLTASKESETKTPVGKQPAGELEIALLANAAQWQLDEPPFKVIRLPADKTDISYTFSQIPAGRYALYAFFDANNNNTLDEDWLGMPTESFTFSGLTPSVGEDINFLDASFIVGGKGKTMTLTLIGME